MKNKDEVIQIIKRLELKNEDLKIEIREILSLISKCDDLDYFEIENVKTYNRMLLDKITELDKNASIINMMKLTFNKLEE